MNESLQKPAVERVSRAPVTAPLVDIYETPDALVLVADLPGVAKNALSIEMKDDLLSLRGERKDLVYERSFKVPPGVDGDKVAAELVDGVLTLELPKPERLKPRKIDVRVA